MLLLHGAGSGPWVFDGWAEAFADVEVDVPDLQAGLNVAEAAMSNYVAVAARAAERLRSPLALCGWSMGGLVAMLLAERAGAERIVLLEPSPPAEVQGMDERIRPEPGAFDPEEVYGSFPPGVPSRPESRLARAERKRGIPVPSLPCPGLVVYGDEFSDERGRQVARVYGTEELHITGLDHWDLVRDPRVRVGVAAWLRGA
jgi:pimeloyl-ACP methyl ester carboxylesterase